MPDGGETRAYWQRMAVVVLAGSCYVGAGRAAVLALLDRSPWDWGELLVYGGTWALGMAVFAAVLKVVRGRDRDQEQGRAMVRAALASGELPEGLNPAAWRRTLAEELREARQSRWGMGSMTLLLAVLVAAAAAVDGGWDVWLLAAALGAFVVVPVRWQTRRAERAEELLARLMTG